MAGRRRGREEGSIYRRKDGRWVGQYEVNGKRRYGYGTTRKDVAEKLAKAIVERDAGLVSIERGRDDAAGKLPIPGTDETSLAGRLPDDLRDTAADPDFTWTPFAPSTAPMSSLPRNCRTGPCTP